MFFSTSNAFGASRKAPGKSGSGKSTWARGVVACGKCGTANTVQRFEAIVDEFSVRCSRCGHRGFYRKNEIGVQQMAERRQKPR
ncbi:hypothetical protein PQJ75_29085 [Rhodoplanes sp. TEM]|uniref:Uncharacterized protein n=1 Tax=Rhodoplanes tepidamans TaxID=200616 RepID=A0ABT5JE83_RHOTP|nr:MULTISPECIES: hypothetical protein [Rhodoplanes]MDC7787917.1 hypothetical protein [Rhodoplanes tepidamans]MDC7987809.1 hypothetical protein [Rhodoplanes sp. TEM]MDQ0354840.1 DNA-directed RNA polymerase subunit RPC12/RpoP [Rhodoplanes tepidamans]